jgi:hypothetical protein
MRNSKPWAAIELSSSFARAAKRKTLSPENWICEHTRPRVSLDAPRVQPRVVRRAVRVRNKRGPRGFARGRAKLHVGRVRSPCN